MLLPLREHLLDTLTELSLLLLIPHSLLAILFIDSWYICVILSLFHTYEHKRYIIVTSLQTSHKLKIHFFFCFKFTIEVYFHKYSNSILFQKATIKNILSLFTQSHCSVASCFKKQNQLYSHFHGLSI